MTKEELIEELKSLIEASWSDAENAHSKADELLLRFIDDEEVSEAFNGIERYYA